MLRNPAPYYQLRDIKRYDSLALLWQSAIKVGPATQTLGAIRRMARQTGKTFASSSRIAEMACRPQLSVERDLQKLVQNRWIIDHGRQGRRTTTYEVVDHLLNRDGDAHSFCILPRWAAKLLSTWAERAVFDAIVSRDALCEYMAGEEGEDVHRRLEYPARQLRLHTGLSLRSIASAKAKLVAQGLMVIDPSHCYPDDRGRLLTIADTLHLNPDFRGPAGLVDRSAKAAETSGKSGGRPHANPTGSPCNSGGCSDSHLLSHPTGSSSTSSAESPSAPQLRVFYSREDVA